MQWVERAHTNLNFGRARTIRNSPSSRGAEVCLRRTHGQRCKFHYVSTLTTISVCWI